ncbi:MAG: preprotein translocase subunit YajC [Bacteroidales bacterium]|nr:preprotein translocase subunit YajC [Bacteroidales bacterium]
MIDFILQAAAPAGAAGAAGAQSATPLGGGASMWIMLILIFVVMYVFMILPQRKQQKKVEEMRNSLAKGDKVVTAGGIYGVIDEVDGKSFLIKVDGNVKIRVDRNCVNADTSDAPAEKK